ncbi:MAG TPA: hypothetical protein VGY58_21805 [Gemmataceae bacterium]|nr:hypothetical protein [Gemmataceae bacterium]
MPRYFLALGVAVVLGTPGFIQAAKVKVWHHHSPADYEKAQLKQTVVSNEGALRLSRQLNPLAPLDARHIWDVIEDRAGNLFVATGDEGKILKVTQDGQVSTLFTGEDSQILCLALAPDGSIYAGTGPGGNVIRIAPDGTARVLYKTPESYVWSLVLDAEGRNVFAGTGPKGRIYEISAAGKARVFYATKQEHILALAMGPDGMLYAGTDKNGVVYRIDPAGKGFVVCTTPQTEVRTLAVTTDGVYAGTSSPTRRRGASGASEGGGRFSTSPANNAGAFSASSGGDEKVKSKGNGVKMANSPSASSSSESSEKGSAAPAPGAPSNGENSVYRITPDGTVREIFREKAMVLSVLRQDGKIFVGTGMDGQLFEVNEATKERSEIARLDHGQIQCLLHRHDGSIVLGTGDPGKLYVLEDRYASRGTVVSEVLDAKLISRWGSLRWKAETPSGTSVSIAVRSGNTPEPDDTWSAWSAEQADAEQATVTVPSARFLQYRITLATTSPLATPVVHSVALRYMTSNQAPEVTAITVPDLDAANLDNPKKIRFKWTATDANEDELSYTLYVRKDGWKNWVQLEEDLDRTEFEWDTTTTPSGSYRLKVVASDRKDNAPEDALIGQKISASFVVAHEAPTVTLKTAGMDGEHVVIDATATDPLVRLTSASYSINGKKWENVFPTDGLFDSKSESFRIKTDALKPGTYVVVLRVKDAAGNTGSGDLVFTVKPKADK